MVRHGSEMRWQVFEKHSRTILVASILVMMVVVPAFPFLLLKLYGSDYNYFYAEVFAIPTWTLSFYWLYVIAEDSRNATPLLSIRRNSFTSFRPLFLRSILAILLSFLLLAFILSRQSAFCYLQPSYVHTLCAMTAEASLEFQRRGVPVWLCAGSLLGVVRDDHPLQMIPWEHDTDLCALESEVSSSYALFRNHPYLTAKVMWVNVAGYRRKQMRLYLKSTSITDAVTRRYVDIFLMHDTDGMVYHVLENVRFENHPKGSDFPVVPSSDVFPLKPITMCDLEGVFLAPNRPDKLLEAEYSKNWIHPGGFPAYRKYTCALNLWGPPGHPGPLPPLPYSRPQP